MCMCGCTAANSRTFILSFIIFPHPSISDLAFFYYKCLNKKIKDVVMYAAVNVLSIEWNWMWLILCLWNVALSLTTFRIVRKNVEVQMNLFFNFWTPGRLNEQNLKLTKLLTESLACSADGSTELIKRSQNLYFFSYGSFCPRDFRWLASF